MRFYIETFYIEKTIFYVKFINIIFIIQGETKMKVVLMAGGRGTRISELFPNIPKPLIPINGIPVLEREIISL